MAPHHADEQVLAVWSRWCEPATRRPCRRPERAFAALAPLLVVFILGLMATGRTTVAAQPLSSSGLLTVESSLATSASIFDRSVSSMTPAGSEYVVGVIGDHAVGVVGAHEDVLPGQRRARAPDYDQTAVGSSVAPNTAGIADDVVGPSVRYNRGAHYGGAQTNSPAGRALREGAEGTACPSCGRPQISGTNTAPVPEHSPSLLEHYYGGGHAMTDAQRRAYAQSADAQLDQGYYPTDQDHQQAARRRSPHQARVPRRLELHDLASSAMRITTMLFTSEP